MHNKLSKLGKKHSKPKENVPFPSDGGWTLLASGWIPQCEGEIDPSIARFGQRVPNKTDETHSYTQVFVEGERHGARLRRIFILDRALTTAFPTR